MLRQFVHSVKVIRNTKRMSYSPDRKKARITTTFVSRHVKEHAGEGGIIDLTKDEDDDASASAPAPASASALPPFQLLRTRGIPSWGNQGPLGFDMQQHVAGNILFAFVSNYMIDIPWLAHTFPDLLFSDYLLIVHGQKGDTEGMKNQLRRLGVHEHAMHVFQPPVPPYGTHHSKAFFLQYPTGIRIIIHTANLLYCDVNNKSQSVYMQDFPLKDAVSERSGGGPSEFELELVQYVDALGLVSTVGRKLKDVIEMHDYSCARCHLVASVPSKPFEFKQVDRYGHKRVGSVLGSYAFDKKFAASPIIAQFSSIGNLSPAFLGSTMESFSSGYYSTEDNAHVALGTPSDGHVRLIWPSVAQIRDSLEGWFGGGSIPGYYDRVMKPMLLDGGYFRLWGGHTTGRQRAMPHMKTYLRFHEESKEIAWVCVGSHNFSKAAWGEVVNSRKYNARLCRILSYELGVVFVPSKELEYRKHRHFGFSCTASSSSSSSSPRSDVVDRVEFHPWTREGLQQERIVTAEHGTRVLKCPMPLAFSLDSMQYPLQPTEDEYDTLPWYISKEKVHRGIDALGHPYPGRGSYFGVLQRDTPEDHWQQLFSS